VVETVVAKYSMGGGLGGTCNSIVKVEEKMCQLDGLIIWKDQIIINTGEENFQV
jgi:hypothetical protein